MFFVPTYIKNQCVTEFCPAAERQIARETPVFRFRRDANAMGGRKDVNYVGRGRRRQKFDFRFRSDRLVRKEREGEAFFNSPPTPPRRSARPRGCNLRLHPDPSPQVGNSVQGWLAEVREKLCASVSLRSPPPPNERPHDDALSR